MSILFDDVLRESTPSSMDTTFLHYYTAPAIACWALGEAPRRGFFFRSIIVINVYVCACVE